VAVAVTTSLAQAGAVPASQTKQILEIQAAPADQMRWMKANREELLKKEDAILIMEEEILPGIALPV
jgi:hypothetical protein